MQFLLPRKCFQFYLSATGLILLAATQTSWAAAPANKTKYTPTERVLQFPADVCYGRLVDRNPQLTNPKFAGNDSAHNILGAAQGLVKLRLDPRTKITFEPNAKLYKNPAALKNFPATGIDTMVIAFVGQDDNEMQFCDELMPYVSQLQSLKYLKMTLCDITDKGFAKLGKLPLLAELDLSTTGLTAKSLPHISQFTAAQNLVLHRVNLRGGDLRKLSALKSLKNLDLSNCLLSDTEMAGLGDLPSLKGLNLANNDAVTDASLKQIAGLRNLNSLVVCRTAITVAGLAKNIKGLHIKHLELTASYIKRQDALALKAALPKGCKIVLANLKPGAPSPFMEQMCAPLHF